MIPGTRLISFAESSQLLGGEKSLATLFLKCLYIGSGIMTSFSQTAVSGVPVDRSNALNDTICGHRFGLTNAPMQLGNVCQVHRIDLHATESRVSVFPQVNTVV